MKNFLAVLYGIVFGVANIIPGVSGGTMLVVFGCYDKVCGALTLNLKEIKKNIVFLCFFGIGAVLGIVGFSFVITALFDAAPIPTYMFFIGLILGSIPLILRNATVKEKLKPICIVPFVISLALVVGLSMLENSTSSEPYTLNCTRNDGMVTVEIINNSDRTINDLQIDIENGKSFADLHVIVGAEAQIHNSLLHQLKHLFTTPEDGDVLNRIVLPEGVEIAPHEAYSFRYNEHFCNFTEEDFDISVSYAMDVPFFLFLMLTAFIAAIAMIIPGVSGSFMLVLFGVYTTVIGAIKNLDIIVLIPVAVGVVLGLILGARLITFLMKRFRLIVFSGILGLVVGSVYAIFPVGFGLNVPTLIGAGTLLAGGAVSYLVGKHTKTE